MKMILTGPPIGGFSEFEKSTLEERLKQQEKKIHEHAVRLRSEFSERLNLAGLFTRDMRDALDRADDLALVRASTHSPCALGKPPRNTISRPMVSGWCRS